MPPGTDLTTAYQHLVRIALALTRELMTLQAEGSYAKAARALGITTSQLLRFLRADPQAWRAAQKVRRRE